MDSFLFDLNAKLERTHWWYQARARIIRKLAETLVPSPTRVLEIGCGTGGVLAALPQSWHRVGVDPAKEAIKLGRALYPELDLRQGTAPEDVREELGNADLVLICDVLEHVEDDVGLFSGIVAGLKAGGQVLLTVPADPTLWTNHDVTHGHFRRYTQARLETLWGHHAAMKVRLFSPFNWRLYPVVKSARLLSQVRNKTLGPGDSDLFLPPAPLNALLRAVFLSEQGALLSRLDQSHWSGFSKGVSWIAVVRKSHADPGQVEPRSGTQGEKGKP